MKIYTELGYAGYIFDLSETPSCPEIFVEMSEERPGLNFIAAQSGNGLKSRHQKMCWWKNSRKLCLSVKAVYSSYDISN